MSADPTLDLLVRAEEACREMQRELVNMTVLLSELRKARAAAATPEKVSQLLARGDVSMPQLVARFVESSSVLFDVGPGAIAALRIETDHALGRG